MTSGINYRTDGPWGSGIGRNLTPAEVDGNFYDHDGRLDDIESNPPVAVSIAAINVVGATMTVFLDDSTELGPFTLPTAEFDWRGAWLEGTAYFEMDVFYAAGEGVYLVNTDFVSASSFDPGGAAISLMLPDRADWHWGSGVPGAGLGGEGDLYLDTASGDVYGHDGSPGWQVVDNITGPTGAAGSDGADGTTINTLDDVPDVDYQTAGPTEGDVLVRRGSEWNPEAQSGAPASLDDIGDVEYGSPGPAEGDVSVYRSGSWVPEAQSGGAGTGAFPYQGALVKRTSDTAMTSSTAISWQSEVHDIGDWADLGADATKLIVPAGVKRVRLAGMMNNASPSSDMQFVIKKNGADLEGRGYVRFATQQAYPILSAEVAVSAGDYFQIIPIFGSGSPSIRNNSWFEIVAVETTESGQTATVQTTDATQTVIASGAMSADSAHTVRAYGHGREDATGDTYHFEILGGARNEGGTSTAPTPNVIEVADAGASGWDATLVANDGTDEWEIKVTGEAAHTIDWTVTWFEQITQQ